MFITTILIAIKCLRSIKLDLQNLTEGFLLGLATGHICFATCGPIYTPYLMMRKYDWLKSVITILEISLGRFISSVIFGAVVGLLGQKITSVNRSYFTMTAYILFSVFLIVSAVRTRSREKGCALSRWGRFADRPLILGLVTGISFCPAFLIALTRAVELSGPVSGALLFTGFFAGTNIYLLPLAVFGVVGNKKVMRKVAVVSAFVVGGWFIFQAGTSALTLYRDSKRTLADYGGSIINLLDKTNMFILTSDTSRFVVVREVLKQNRKGSVLLTNSVDNIPDSGYVFVDPDWAQKTNSSVEGLKRKKRFVLVLPLHEDSADYTKPYTERLIAFLGPRYFKCDTLSGSLFDMSGFFKN